MFISLVEKPSSMDAYKILETVRDKKPLVHHITNWVTISDCAQITRSAGALPVMAHAKEEVTEMVKLASSLVLNIGTLTNDLVDSMILAGGVANVNEIPVIIDAVGAGATNFRTESMFKILNEVKVSVLKGNAGEIAALTGVESVVKGVESISVEASNEEIAKKAYEKFGIVVVITGKEDIVYGKSGGYIVKNGCSVMGEVVGTGCMATSILGCFCAVSNDLVLACAAGLSCYEIAAEKAEVKCSGPMDFKIKLFDELSKIKGEDLKKLKVEKI